MKEKSIEMMRYNVQWVEVAKELNVTEQTVYNWRNKGTTKQKQIMDMAIETIIEDRKKQVQ